ncbi:uncharacterized protein LOC125372026 [Haliotis rufescens]|uniref:uncharacterized protein LOC125372026 n=1 Tax=Haliotis rufescens TaxID=6454 RepID=UPI00201F9E6C|nr:uncharacterized protein LOC125372026 [Haliotis rufescens]
MQKFLSAHGKSDTNTKNEDTANSTAFSALCRWLSFQQNSQFTIQDLQSRLASYLAEDVEPYSIKHLQRRLLEHFGAKVTIAEVEGRANVVTFVDKAATILQNSYHEDDSDKDDTLQQDRMLGCHIRKRLEGLKKTDLFYPCPQDTDIDKLENEVPDVLLVFVRSLMRKATTETAFEKQRLEVVSHCHALMQASAPNPYLSPLMLSTGVFIHQTRRSRVLLNVFFSLGFSVSYDQVMDFEKSAVVSKSVEDLPPGIEAQDQGGGFCQWVADNFDYNEDTVTGHNSTHVMGIIACQTQASKPTITVQRKKKTSADIASSGDFGHIIQPYSREVRHGSHLVFLKKLIKFHHISASLTEIRRRYMLMKNVLIKHYAYSCVVLFVISP